LNACFLLPVIPSLKNSADFLPCQQYLSAIYEGFAQVYTNTVF
jgi:hypothetical protein